MDIDAVRAPGSSASPDPLELRLLADQLARMRGMLSAAFSLGRPLGMMSVMTLGYSAGAFLLWLAGILGLRDWVDANEEMGLLSLGPPLADVLVPIAIAWVLLIAAYLVWTFLSGHDERRLLAELYAASGAAPDTSPDTSPD